MNQQQNNIVEQLALAFCAQIAFRAEVELSNRQYYYKNNHRSEGIHVANARTKVIIFCKSRPLNWN